MNSTVLAVCLLSDILDDMVLSEENRKVHDWKSLCDILPISDDLLDPQRSEAIRLCRKACREWSTTVLDPETFTPKFVFYKPTFEQTTKTLSSLVHGEYL